MLALGDLDKQVIPERTAFYEYPTRIGDWRTEPQLLPIDVQQVLKADDYFIGDFDNSAGETVGLLTALAGELDRQNNKDEYTNAIRNYRLAVDPGSIDLWREQADEAYAKVADAEDTRDKADD